MIRYLTTNGFGFLKLTHYQSNRRDDFLAGR